MKIIEFALVYPKRKAFETKCIHFALVLLILSASFAFFYRLRGAILLPMTNVQRLYWLNHYEGLDCVSFLMVAHGNQRPSEWVGMDDWYVSQHPNHFDLVTTYAKRADIDESKLQPGDIAAFVGHPQVIDEGYTPVRPGLWSHKETLQMGKHVAAFLRPGVWTDSDTRRGGVAEYDLRLKPAEDDWFSGQVRILRWKI